MGKADSFFLRIKKYLDILRELITTEGENMNRQGCIALLASVGFVFCGALNVHAVDGADQLSSEANQVIAVASQAVEDARSSIEMGKRLVAMIPADSEFQGEVKEMLVAASENWNLAIKALEGAKASASRISTASSLEIAGDYKLLATVNAGVALAGARVVQTGLDFVEAVANNKTESLGIIRMAMQDGLAAASQVEFNYERVKTLIAKKYSK
jgi:uncharacterized protein YunC (DUF1805 family)